MVEGDATHHATTLLFVTQLNLVHQLTKIDDCTWMNLSGTLEGAFGEVNDCPKQYGLDPLHL